MDFYDLKGIITGLMEELHIEFEVEPAEHPTFHPGKTCPHPGGRAANRCIR